MATTSPKQNLEAAKTALKAFMKANKLKEDSTPEDKKIAKEFKNLQAAVLTARAAVKEAKGASSGRKSTIEYPEGMTDPKEKKKHRAKLRNAAKPKAEKPAKAEKAPKAEKAAEKPAKKKKKAAAEVED